MWHAKAAAPRLAIANKFANLEYVLGRAVLLFISVSLSFSLIPLSLSLDPFAVECDLCIAAELPDEVLCVLEIDNIIRNAHKLRTHTAERNGTKRECSGTKWNGTKTTDIGLPLDSCSLKRLIAMIQLHVLRALTLPFSPTVSIFPSPSCCLFCSCHLR